MALGVLALMVAGLVLLFPGLRREEITFRHELASPECVDRVVVDLFDDDVLVRSQRRVVDGRHAFEHRTKLRHGTYITVVRLECGDGSRHERRVPVVVDREGVIPFKSSGAECCETRGAPK